MTWGCHRFVTEVDSPSPTPVALSTCKGFYKIAISRRGGRKAPKRGESFRRDGNTRANYEAGMIFLRTA